MDSTLVLVVDIKLEEVLFMVVDVIIILVMGLVLFQAILLRLV